IVERTCAVLHRHGLGLADGQLELYPARRPLRAPCGRGTVLLEVADPAQPDPLGLRPVPGTTATRHVLRAGERYARTVRRPGARVAAFLPRWEAARLPLDTWLADGRAWSPVWGPFAHAERDRSKNDGAGATAENRSSQHIDDVSGAPGGAAGGV